MCRPKVVWMQYRFVHQKKKKNRSFVQITANSMKIVQSMHIFSSVYFYLFVCFFFFVNYAHRIRATEMKGTSQFRHDFFHCLHSWTFFKLFSWLLVGSFLFIAIVVVYLSINLNIMQLNAITDKVWYWLWWKCTQSTLSQ